MSLRLSPRFSTQPPPLSPTVLSSSPDYVLSEKNRKKNFPSVAKLLDGLSFPDETHPDFLLRASRFRSSRPNPLLHPSPPTLYVRSTISTSLPNSNLLISGHPNLTRVHHALESSTGLSPTPQSLPSSSIPLLIQRTSASTCNTASSLSPSSPTPSQSSTLETLSTSFKRPYSPSADENDDDESEEEDAEEEEDDDDDNDGQSGHNRVSASDRARESSVFGLGIDWQSKLSHSRRAADYDRPIARPSRTWLSKHAVDRSMATSDITATVGDGGCLDEQKLNENHLIQLMASRSIEIRQVDKRRREFIFFFFASFLFPSGDLARVPGDDIIIKKKVRALKTKGLQLPSVSSDSLSNLLLDKRLFFKTSDI